MLVFDHSEILTDVGHSSHVFFGPNDSLIPFCFCWSYRSQFRVFLLTEKKRIISDQLISLDFGNKMVNS